MIGSTTGHIVAARIAHVQAPVRKGMGASNTVFHGRSGERYVVTTYRSPYRQCILHWSFLSDVRRPPKTDC